MEAINKSYYISDVLRTLELEVIKPNYLWLRSKIKELNADISHFLSYKSIITKTAEIKLDEILIENSTYLNTSRLKMKLYKANLLQKICSICGITEWCDEPISLHLDHINGIPSDNRLENLRILCPNCHWQLGEKKMPNKIGRRTLLKTRAESKKNRK